MEAKINNFDYLLIDRGIYDHIAFTLALYKSGQITNKQYRAQLEYFKEFQFLEDLTLIFLINPEEAIKRENKHHNFTGRVMNKDFLSVLYEAYEKTIPEIEQKNFLIDGSKSVEENKKEILNFVIS